MRWRKGKERKYGEKSCFRFILKNLISNGKNIHDWKQYFHRIFSYKSSLFWKHKEYRSHISFNARAFCFLFSIPTLINCFIVSANQPSALITDAHFVFFLRIALLVLFYFRIIFPRLFHFSSFCIFIFPVKFVLFILPLFLLFLFFYIIIK